MLEIVRFQVSKGRHLNKLPMNKGRHFQVQKRSHLQVCLQFNINIQACKVLVTCKYVCRVNIKACKVLDI